MVEHQRDVVSQRIDGVEKVPQQNGQLLLNADYFNTIYPL